MGAFERLIEVQDHDTVADQLRHRRQTLPELTELVRAEDKLAELERRAEQLRAERDGVARQQRRHEDELASAEAKAAEIDRTLYSGTVRSPRELQALQAELESLRRLQAVIEDRVLEAMTERDPLDAALAGVDAERDRLDREGARLRATIAETQAAIDAELAVETEARSKAAADVPAELARLYEELRAKLGGTGAARLVNGRCSGCHLTLPAMELDRLRREPPDAVIRCEQCGRLLVR